MIDKLWPVLWRWLAVGLVAALVLEGAAWTAVAGDDGEDGDDVEWDGDDRDDDWDDDDWDDNAAAPVVLQQQTPAAVIAEDDEDDDDDDDDDDCVIESEEDGGDSDGYCADQLITRLVPGVDADAINAAFGTETISAISGQSVFLLRLPQNSVETDYASTMEEDNRVRWAELNFIDQAPEGSPRRFYLRAGDAAPTAGDLGQAYAPDLLGVPAALTCVDGRGVKVAVIDSGLDPDHPMFASIPMDAKDAWNAFSDQDGFGNVDDIGNSEDDDGDGLIDEMTGHGTHVTGIIAQIAPNAAIMPIKALDSDGVGQAFYLARALYRAVDRDADIINLSLGTTANTRVVRDAAGDVAAAGVFVAAAAGNSGPEGLREYPATLGDDFGVVGIAATNRQDRAADFSSVHQAIDLSAPGDGIVSAFPIDQPPDNKLPSPYALWSGTSMATPWVSGAAALLLERHPGWTPAQIASQLQATASPIAGSAAGMGSGRLDVAAAVGCDAEATARGDNATEQKAKKGKRGKNGKGKKGKNTRKRR